ncbi:hypothetical protein Tco_0195838 [Tanacetum coccineum]
MYNIISLLRVHFKLIPFSIQPEAHDKEETRADVSASGWSANDWLVSERTKILSADQSEADTSAYVSPYHVPLGHCAAIGYGFLPFSLSSLGELEADAVTLLKRIRKFSMAQDIGARVAVHIFNRISFAIAKGVEAQIISRLPSNLL